MTAKLAVVGTGRSGAVTAACLADLGHTVCAFDVNADLIARLEAGSAPFVEPQLDDVIKRNMEAGRLTFTTDAATAISPADAVLLCLPTPASDDGTSDLSALYAGVDSISAHLAPDAVLITRSTVPVGTNAALQERLRGLAAGGQHDVVSNPEFLREGRAVDDFMTPDRIVIGAVSEAARKRVAGYYAAIECPMVLTDLETAELAKYAANAYLAASVSFINEIANICERTGADISQVAQALALDHRIGPDAYLMPGIGYGGSCLPKDLSALISTAEQHGYTAHLLSAVSDVNERQPAWVVEQLRGSVSRLEQAKVAVLGISFKGGTFDARSSPALATMRLLQQAGVAVRAYDPFADDATEALVKGFATLHPDAYAAAEGCVAVVIATDHREFSDLNLARLGRLMQTRLFVDGRNLFDPEAVLQAGFSYVGVGRAHRGD